MGHISVTIDSTKYDFNIDLPSYSEVDVTDFSPRIVSGTPKLSEQGIYLDIGQDNWKHGFGFPFFTDPKGYMYSGTNIDTRHGFIQLGTKLATGPHYSSQRIEKIHNHGDTEIVLHNAQVRAILDGDTDVQLISSHYGDVMSNGMYFYLVRDGRRMQLCDIRSVSSTTGTTTTLDVDNGDYPDDVFNGGTIKIISGTGAVQSKTITDTQNGDTLHHAAWSIDPDATSVCFVYVDTGNDGNPPNNFTKLSTFGGYFWAIEARTNYLHFWAEADGSDAEGGGGDDAGAVAVGPPGRTPVNMIAFDNQLWVFREDGAWVVGEDNLAYHTLDYASETHENNFQSVIVWNGFLVFSIRNRVYKYKSGLQDITPDLWDQEFPLKMFGDFDNFVARGKFLYCTAKPNTPFEWETVEQDYAVHAMLSFDGVGWHKLHALNLTNDIPLGTTDNVYMGLDPYNNWIVVSWTLGGGTVNKIYQLQSESDLPYASYSTDSPNYWYSSWIDLGLPRINKSFASVTLVGQFSLYQRATLRYRLKTDEGEDDWYSGDTANVDEVFTYDFPDGTTGKKIQLALTLDTTQASLSPIVEQVILKCMLRPEVIYGVSCDIIVSGDLRTQNGRQLGLTAKQIRSALKEMRDSVSPITLTDIHGESADAYLASLRFITIAYEDMDTVQEIARVTFTYV